MLYPDWF